MTINNRLESIRKNEKLSRVKFGKKLGKTEDAIYNLERGRASITDEFIDLVCDIFRVNKSWLENGTGSMYNISDESLKLGDAFNKIIDSKELSKLVSDLIDLSDDKIKILSSLVEVLSDNEPKK